MSRKDDDFIDYLMFSEVMGEDSGSSGGGACGCCCMPVLIIIGILALIIS